MTGLGRLLQYAAAYAPDQYPVFKSTVDAHEEEDAARDADMKQNFEVADKALRERDRLQAELATLRKHFLEVASGRDHLRRIVGEKNAELAALREAVRTYMDNKDSGQEPYLWDDLRQLAEEKPVGRAPFDYGVKP